MRVKVFSSSSVEESVRKVEDMLHDDSFSPSLAIFFGSVSLGVEKVKEAFENYAFSVIGASSSGEIIADKGVDIEKVILEKSLVGALVDIPEDVFKVRMFSARGLSSVDLGTEIANWGKRTFNNPAFLVMGSGIQLDADGILEGMLSSVDRKTPIVGGVAGDDGKFERTFVWTKDSISDFGILATVFDADRIEIANVAASGWTGVGTEKTVTEAEGNVVFSIDGRPAAELYAEYLNISVEDIARVGVEYPLLLKRSDGGYILRAVLGADKEKGALIFAGRVPVGSKVMFSAAAGTGATENVKEIIRSYKREVPEAEFILLFSCIARYLAIGPLAKEEVLEVERSWGAPLIGFFTYGGFGRLVGSGIDFHNETISVALFKER